MLAIIKVLENLLNFFSLALTKSVTKVSVIPAKSINKKGQNLVIIPEVKYETASDEMAIAAVKKIRFRINRFIKSFMRKTNLIY